MVTGASGVIGQALIPYLLERDEVRATVRRPDAAEPLRALGAKVAVDGGDDAEALAEILPRVVTLIHLVGGPHQLDDDAILDANHGSTLRALAAAKAAGVPRFVLVSVPGASPDAADPFLRAKGLAEEAVADERPRVRDRPRPRTSSGSAVCGSRPWSRARSSDPPVAIGGDAPVAPVFADDLAAVLAAIEARPGELAGTWALEGPDAPHAGGAHRDADGRTERGPRNPWPNSRPTPSPGSRRSWTSHCRRPRSAICSIPRAPTRPTPPPPSPSPARRSRTGCAARSPAAEPPRRRGTGPN